MRPSLPLWRDLKLQVTETFHIFVSSISTLGFCGWASGERKGITVWMWRSLGFLWWCYFERISLFNSWGVLASFGCSGCLCLREIRKPEISFGEYAESAVGCHFIQFPDGQFQKLYVLDAVSSVFYFWFNYSPTMVSYNFNYIYIFVFIYIYTI